MANSAARDARHLEVVGAYYQTGDEAPLGPMLGELRQQALAYLRGTLRVRDAEAAADVAQEALSTLLGRLRARTFDPVRPPGVLLCVLCRYAHLGRKHDPSEPGLSEQPYLLLPASTATQPQELPADEVRTAAYRMLSAATQAVLALDHHARAAVVLHYYQGLDAPAAALKLGIAESAFRERLRRGLVALQAWGRTVARPPAEVYAALSGVDSGDLFREPLRMAS
jgi:DNA-directed RNA polymerase specialized sigma24 family protein